MKVTQNFFRAGLAKWRKSRPGCPGDRFCGAISTGPVVQDGCNQQVVKYSKHQLISTVTRHVTKGGGDDSTHLVLL